MHEAAPACAATGHARDHAAAADWLGGQRHSSNGLVNDWLAFINYPTVAGFWAEHDGSILGAAGSAMGQALFAAESGTEQVFIDIGLFWLSAATGGAGRQAPAAALVGDGQSSA